MNKAELNYQKRLVQVFQELEKEKEKNFSETHKLGYMQRNELINHVYSNYQNHENLNKAREKWLRSGVKGNVMNWVYDLFKSRRDLYGYFENPKEIPAEIKDLLDKAIETERYEIAKELQYWLDKIVNDK